MFGCCLACPVSAEIPCLDISLEQLISPTYPTARQRLMAPPSWESSQGLAEVASTATRCLGDCLSVWFPAETQHGGLGERDGFSWHLVIMRDVNLTDDYHGLSHRHRKKVCHLNNGNKAMYGEIFLHCHVATNRHSLWQYSIKKLSVALSRRTKQQLPVAWPIYDLSHYHIR